MGVRYRPGGTRGLRRRRRAGTNLGCSVVTGLDMQKGERLFNTGNICVYLAEHSQQENFNRLHPVGGDKQPV